MISLAGDQTTVVKNWLRSLDLDQYLSTFLDNGYDDVEICKAITEKDLDAIGMMDPAHREQLLHAVCSLREQGSADLHFNANNPARYYRTYRGHTPTELPSYAKYSFAELSSFVKSYLQADGINLRIFSEDSDDIGELAEAYAIRLQMDTETVLECMLRMRKAAVGEIDYGSYEYGKDEDPKAASHSRFVPGKYMPSSCLSRNDGNELYGYSGQAVTKLQELYDSPILSDNESNVVERTASGNKIFVSFNVKEPGSAQLSPVKSGMRKKDGSIAKLLKFFKISGKDKVLESPSERRASNEFTKMVTEHDGIIQILPLDKGILKLIRSNKFKEWKMKNEERCRHGHSISSASNSTEMSFMSEDNGMGGFTDHDSSIVPFAAIRVYNQLPYNWEIEDAFAIYKLAETAMNEYYVDGVGIRLCFVTGPELVPLDIAHLFPAAKVAKNCRRFANSVSGPPTPRRNKDTTGRARRCSNKRNVESDVSGIAVASPSVSPCSDQVLSSTTPYVNNPAMLPIGQIEFTYRLFVRKWLSEDPQLLKDHIMNVDRRIVREPGVKLYFPFFTGIRLRGIAGRVPFTEFPLHRNAKPIPIHHFVGIAVALRRNKLVSLKKQALQFEDGDMICLLGLCTEGLWKGINYNTCCMGYFYLHDVRVIRKGSKSVLDVCTISRNAEEFLHGISMEDYRENFVRHGFATMMNWLPMTDEDLDSMDIRSPEIRAIIKTKIYTLADFARAIVLEEKINLDKAILLKKERTLNEIKPLASNVEWSADSNGRLRSRSTRPRHHHPSNASLNEQENNGGWDADAESDDNGISWTEKLKMAGSYSKQDSPNMPQPARPHAPFIESGTDTHPALERVRSRLCSRAANDACSTTYIGPAPDNYHHSSNTMLSSATLSNDNVTSARRANFTWRNNPFNETNDRMV